MRFGDNPSRFGDELDEPGETWRYGSVDEVSFDGVMTIGVVWARG